MYNSLNFRNKSVIKNFCKNIGTVSKVCEVGKRHSKDLRKIIDFDSSSKTIDFIRFDKLMEKNNRHVDLFICVDTLYCLSPNIYNWEEIIESQISKAKYSIIINPMWDSTGSTINLVDNGLEWYIKNVPIKSNEYIKKWYANGNTYDKSTGKYIRDSHGVWQLGVSEQDLKKCFLRKKCVIVEEYYLGINEKPWIKNKAFLIRNDEI